MSSTRTALRETPEEGPGPQPSLPDEMPSPEPGENEEFAAKIVHRIFPKTFTKDDEFAVYAVEGAGKRATKITYAGTYRPEKGEKVVARGKWVSYRNEPSFKAVIMTPEIPRGAEGVQTYLKIAKIEGVGKTTINDLVQFYGESLPQKMEDVDALAEAIKSKGKRKISDQNARTLAQRISTAWTGHIGQPKLISYLAEFGLREALIQKVINRFGGASRKMVDENPWRLAEVINGIGFNKADLIGRKAGLDPACQARVKAGIRYTLDLKTNQQGHCGLSRAALEAAGDELLGVGKAVVAAQIDAVIKDRDAILDEELGLIYPLGLYKAETSVAERVTSIMRKGDRVAETEARAAVEDAVTQLGVQRDESQVDAAVMAVSNPVSIITGGPGTGKSTTQRIIVLALEKLGKSIVLAAPTGRAAKRLSEVSGREASTCHRLLSFSAEKGDFLFDRSNPFPQQRFIVDEFSMIDVRTASSFMDAIKDKGGITIVGDVDQLPSVGAGQVLRDLIESGLVPTARLKTVHRQQGDSGIVVAAAKINGGEHPLPPGEKLDGFYVKTSFPTYGGEDELVRDVVDFMTRRLPANGYNPVDDIQVLCAQKSREIGTYRLNAEIKAVLNPGTEDNTASFRTAEGEVAYSTGDRVMHIRNDYAKKVYNGEVGIVCAVGMRRNDDGKEVMSVQVDYSGHKVWYSQEDISDMQMAWASTVHKSQGCEFPVVIFVCPNAHKRMLTKNLFYTAVTRAKKVCIVLGNDEAVKHAVKTEDVDKRATGLAKRIAA